MGFYGSPGEEARRGKIAWSSGLLRRCIQEWAKETTPVGECACVARVERIGRIPLHDQGFHDVIRIERGTIVETNALTQLKRPFGEILIGLVGLSQNGLDC